MSATTGKVSRLPKWARERIQELEEAADLSILEHGAADPCICQECRVEAGFREAIASTWEAVADARSGRRDDEPGAIRAWRAARSVREAGRLEMP